MSTGFVAYLGYQFWINDPKFECWKWKFVDNAFTWIAHPGKSIFFWDFTGLCFRTSNPLAIWLLFSTKKSTFWKKDLAHLKLNKMSWMKKSANWNLKLKIWKLKWVVFFLPNSSLYHVNFCDHHFQDFFCYPNCNNFCFR